MKIFLFCFALFLSLSSVSAQETQFGSLAIDDINGNQYGWAINYETQKEANQRAIEECQKNGGNNCHTVLWFEGGCAVYIVDSDNPGLYGWGVADTRDQAENIARSEAIERGGSNLKLRVWGCNDGDLISSNQKPVGSSVKGIYMFYQTESTSDKKFYITNLLYESDAALKNGDKWQWSADAESKIKPTAVKFWDAVEADLYSYLSPEMLEKLKAQGHITRNKNVDWTGISEIEYTNAKIDLLDKEERREFFQILIDGVVDKKRNEGYEIIEIKL